LVALPRRVSGWSLKSIAINGRDLSDQPLELSTTEMTSLVVTMTDRPLQLTGAVRDANNRETRKRRGVSGRPAHGTLGARRDRCCCVAAGKPNAGQFRGNARYCRQGQMPID
jgi:hypothetical protein